MTDQHNAIQTAEKPKARTEFDAWLKRVKNAPLYWNQSDAMLAAFVAGHAVALSKLPAPVTDLRPHLEWALRRIGTSLDTGDKYEAAQAALDAARAAPQASASSFAKLQSAYVGACDQLGELLASVPRASQSRHPDDIAVDSFAVAMKAKLAKKRAEGRGGWSDKSQCTAEFLSQLLHGHVDKGDPVDVGNLAMMLHQRGERITPSKAVPSAGSQPATNAQPYGYLDCFGIFYRYKAFANMTPVYISAIAAQQGAGGDHE
ncbi:hypothetical protein [Achromobacter xylosoxidans]|uniref:hypothetical protein n=1 Tax=Alcaligenes xylosoxydans xylosoxydans TaxID=85698 RepID=UPI001F1419E3|nr:hypothetical protein [Achromobacter xylosoxidans]